MLIAWAIWSGENLGPGRQRTWDLSHHQAFLLPTSQSGLKLLSGTIHIQVLWVGVPQRNLGTHQGGDVPTRWHHKRHVPSDQGYGSNSACTDTSGYSPNPWNRRVWLPRLHSGSRKLAEHHSHWRGEPIPEWVEGRGTSSTRLSWAASQTTLVNPYRGQPYFVSEFGGIWWNPKMSTGTPGVWRETEKHWRVLWPLWKTLYDPTAESADVRLLYTQLTDIDQEQNGIYTHRRDIKFDMQRIRCVRPRSQLLRS